MDIDYQETLLGALRAFAPQVLDKTRAQLEQEASAIAISLLLSVPQGLALVEYIAEELEFGKRPIYITDKFLEHAELQQIIEHFYLEQNRKAIIPLLLFYHQIWQNERQEPANPRALYAALTKLNASNVIATRTFALNICLDCHSSSDMISERCAACGKDNLLKVYELSLAQPARDVLKEGRYLELYVKESLRKSGIELVGYAFDKQGKKAYTSVRYQVEGEQIDVDVHGISKPLALFLCEVKTSVKIPMNELRRVEGLFKRFIEAINSLSGNTYRHLNLFVITGTFDQNIPVDAYRRKNWELIDRANIPGLLEVLKKIQSEI